MHLCILIRRFYIEPLWTVVGGCNVMPGMHAYALRYGELLVLHCRFYPSPFASQISSVGSHYNLLQRFIHPKLYPRPSHVNEQDLNYNHLFKVSN